MSGGPGLGLGVRYGEVQCIMDNGHMGPLPPCRQTDTTENITFPQLRWRAVMTLCKLKL